MSFIIGNTKVLSDFKKAKETGRLSHAYIIEGAEGSGRLTLARAIACTFSCHSENAPCYSCDTCKKIMSGGHQDVRELIHLDRASPIKIDTVRELIKEAYIKPGESERKIFIVENAQQMGIPAQNALLQVFEEPPKNVTFFLLTTNRNLLLPTLKSRAVTLKTEKLTDETVASEIEKRFPQHTGLWDETVILADGALGKAISLLSEEKTSDSVTLTKEYFSKMKEYASFSSLSMILNQKSVPDRASLFNLMTYFTLALRDILVYNSGYDGKLMFFANRETVRILADRMSESKLMSAYDTVCTVIRDHAKINLLSALSEINMAMCDDFQR
ncbi:MAG: hypothetical protein IJ323_00630 [Clostridia bacterium]|nr:hypothetical protein [Clostridia bacterium]